MKSITVYFENEEFKELSKEKDEKTWHDFIMTLIKNKPKKGEKNGKNEK